MEFWTLDHIFSVANHHEGWNFSDTTETCFVSCNVETEDLTTGTCKKICSTAYFTFVATDAQKNKVPMPPLTPVTDEEKLEYEKALQRRDVRLKRKTKIKETADLSQKIAEERQAAVRVSSFRTSSSESTKKEELEAVTMKSTAVVSTEIVFNQHANHHGTLFGGQVLDWMCNVATISASRLRRGYCILKSIDDVHFLQSTFQGERVVIYSQVNSTFQTSLEVGVRVEAYPIGGASRVINAAYFTFVALDKTGAKIRVPEVIPLDENDQRRFHEARARRKIRLERRSARGGQIGLSVKWDENKKDQLVTENHTNLAVMRGLQWDLISETNGVSLSMKEDSEGGTTSIKVEGNITEPASKIFKFLSHPSKRNEWDPFYESSYTVRKLDELNSIIHIRLKSSATDNSIRDYVVLASLRLPSSFSPSFLISLRSIDVPELPVQPGVIRNETKSSGFIIYPLSDQMSRVTFINQMSPATASHYATDIVGASKKLQESFINIRRKITYATKPDEKARTAEEPHYADADVCKQS